jgi:hypothetical protein
MAERHFSDAPEPVAVVDGGGGMRFGEVACVAVFDKFTLSDVGADVVLHRVDIDSGGRVSLTHLGPTAAGVTLVDVTAGRVNSAGTANN